MSVTPSIPRRRCVHPAVVGVATTIAVLTAGPALAGGPFAWSDPAAWDGAPPAAGDHAVVAAGRTIVLDVDPPALASLTVAGTLQVPDVSDRAVRTGWMLIDGGRVLAGTPETPHVHRLDLTLDGPDEDVMGMGMGGRFLAVRGGGELQLHGARAAAESWALLVGDVDPGMSALHLDRPSGWRPGDRICLAPSGYDAREAEALTITDVSPDGRTIEVDPPLLHRHLGSFVTVAGRSIDMRAEVGLLSRDIVIQAPADAVAEEFGFHAMFMAETTVELSGVEFVRGGQIRKPGRYPVHFHLGGEGADDSVRSCSVHDSFQRGVVVHGTSRVTVEDTVVFDVWSHGFVPSEDGTEFDGVFRRNLAMLIKRRPNEDFSFPRDDHTESDQAEHRPAGFWYRNYHTVMEDNRAAGSVEGNGFFVDSRLMVHQTKQAVRNDLRPIVFRGNVAHSNFREHVTGGGIPTYGPKTRAHGLLVHRYASIAPVVFRDFTAYKNSVGGIWIEDDTHVVDGAVLADSSIGVLVHRSTLRDVFFVQQSPNDLGGGVQDIGNRGAPGGGIHLQPSGYGNTRPWIDRMTIVDCVPAAVFSWQDPVRPGQAFRGITRINTPRAILSGQDADQVDHPLLDADGSLTGLGPVWIGGPDVGPGAVWRADLELWTVPAIGAPCAVDLDRSGQVDTADLLAVLSAWTDETAAGDLDGDGMTAFGDLAIVLSAWGSVCGE